MIISPKGKCPHCGVNADTVNKLLFSGDTNNEFEKLKRHAYLLAKYFATTDENGNLLPIEQQKNKQIREIFKITGNYDV